MIVPDSRIILLKTPFEIDKRNQLTFSNSSSQFTYFNSLPKLEYDECSYQRKDKVIRYITGNEPGRVTYEDLLEYNYCMYQNTSYSNKWFYAYIDNIEYKNDGMSEISISTDTFQSWQFDINYKRSFIEREHVNDDTIGLHTIPEGLEHGEYINAQDKTDFVYSDTCYIVIATTEMFDKNVSRPQNTRYNGIFSGLIYNIFKTVRDANDFIVALDKAGRGEAINSVFMITSFLALDTMTDAYSFEVDTGTSTHTAYFYILKGSTEAVDFGTIRITRPNHIGTNYSPRNNKLYTFPYNYFIVSNNTGSNATYNYELFSNGSAPTFNVYGCISPGCSIKAIPNNYKGVTSNIEESINGAKLPICSWASDVYTNWLTQNSVNNSLGFASSIIQTVGSVATGNVSGTLNGILGIGERMGEIYQHSLTPNQAKGNTNSGDVVFSTGNSDFNIYYMTIKDEYCTILDNFFDMFGYKVNTVKTPNITGRPNWNYVKTIDINITGDIPQKDLEDIRGIFNSGVTFWHNPNTFLDYSQNNK